MNSKRTLLRLSGTAGATTLVVLGVGLTSATAQSEPTFTVEPASAQVGDPLTLRATGCTSEGVDQADLRVFVLVEGFHEGDLFPTDADGTMSVVTPPLAAEAAGERYGFVASCRDVSGEEAVVVFDYPQTPTVDVAVAPTSTTSTTTTTIPTTITAPAGPDRGVRPAFTG